MLTRALSCICSVIHTFFYCFEQLFLLVLLLLKDSARETNCIFMRMIFVPDVVNR